MPKMKYSPELKAQVLAEYEECGDAKIVAQKHGVEPKQVWAWKNSRQGKAKTRGGTCFQKTQKRARQTCSGKRPSSGDCKKNCDGYADRLTLAKELSNSFPSGAVTKRLGIPSSTYYDSITRREPGPGPIKRAKGPVNPEEDSFIRRYISIKRSQKFFESEGGYRKLSLYCRRDTGIVCNHKRMYRLCKEAGVLLAKKKRKIRLRRLSVDREVTAPNRLWQFDIKYGFVHGENNFFFVCAFIDVFDRGIRGYHIGKHCKSEDILRTLRLALKNNGIGPEDHLVIRSDNGPQMSSKKFEKRVGKPPGRPRVYSDQNAEQECLY